MDVYINSETFWLFLGGIYSLVLTVVMIVLKQLRKRDEKAESLKPKKIRQPEFDIDGWLDNNGFAKPNIFQLLTLLGLQPLLIIYIVNLINKSNTMLDLTILLALMLFTIIHEFRSGDKCSMKTLYQIFLLSVWLAMFFFTSYRTNATIKHTTIPKAIKCQVQNNDTTHCHD